MQSFLALFSFFFFFLTSRMAGYFLSIAETKQKKKKKERKKEKKKFVLPVHGCVESTGATKHPCRGDKEERRPGLPVSGNK